MTKQSDISRDSATSLRSRARKQRPMESMTQYQPDTQLTPFTRDTHLCIMIERRSFVLTNCRPSGAGGDRGC